MELQMQASSYQPSIGLTIQNHLRCLNHPHINEVSEVQAHIESNQIEDEEKWGNFDMDQLDHREHLDRGESNGTLPKRWGIHVVSVSLQSDKGSGSNIPFRTISVDTVTVTTLVMVRTHNPQSA